MSEQVEVEKEESQADKAVKELIKYKKRDEERTAHGMDDDSVDWSWRTAEAKLQVLGVIDIIGSIFCIYEAVALRDPIIGIVAFLALLLGVYLIS